jgi:hypothetical protein
MRELSLNEVEATGGGISAEGGVGIGLGLIGLGLGIAAAPVGVVGALAAVACSYWGGVVTGTYVVDLF